MIDHSVQVDEFASRLAIGRNVELEFERNKERYAFLRWGQSAFDNFKVVPPNTGIVHQVNLEYLARVVESRDGMAFPDTLVGTDSHTTMINGLGVLGWGVGGIEAEAAMLGEALSMLVPQVVGFRLTGELPQGATATDLVLTVTEILRKVGVVGKFVEYFGPGVPSLALADRATLGNMSPEYGATCGFFPVDDVTLAYLRLTNRSEQHVALVEAYCKENMLWHEPDEHPTYSQVVELDLERRRAVARRPAPPAGPRAAREREGVVHRGARHVRRRLHERQRRQGARRHVPRERPDDRAAAWRRAGAGRRRADDARRDGRAQVGAGARRGLHARARLRRDRRDHLVHEHVEPVGDDRRRAAREEGGRARPAAQAVGEVVARARLEGRDRVLPARRGSSSYLDELGFNLVGYGCTTCIGNSGPLPDAIGEAVTEGELVVCAVLSGNRNFEARIHSDVKANYLASPPLVVAYALAGRMDIDLLNEPIGEGDDGPVYLHDIWPTSAEIDETIASVGRRRDVQGRVRRRLHRRRALARARHAGGRPLRVGSRLDVRAPAAVLRRHAARAARRSRTSPARACS